MGGLSAASGGRNIESGDLLSLQARMKKDPPGYEQELLLQLRHFDACVSVLLLQSSSSSSSSTPASATEAGAAKEVADVAMFLAHMAPFYPQYLKELPHKLLRVLELHVALQPTLRRSLTQAIVLLRNRKMVELVDLLPVLMDIQCIGDRVARKIAFLHIVHDIRRMNLKHKNEPVNNRLRTVLVNLLQGENEEKAKRSLVVLAELHRRKVWADERTANAICTACLHKSSRIMIAALRFLLGYDQQKDEEDGDDSGSEEDEATPTKSSVTVGREAIYKAYHKGTTASKKKKQNKLQRAVRSMQKQQRSQSREMEQGSHAPLQHVVDPQNFAEKLFARLRSCNERFEVKLMMMQVISRTVGIHRLMLLNFYPFVQKYIEPHQRDVTQVLAAAVQACHDLVPPDAVESMVRQLVNHFVHDRARPEVIAVGLNVMREICMRIPLIMTPELLTDLALYKKNREKAVAAAARSIIAVYRQLWPSLLEKKDRGRNADLSARPKAFGATSVGTGVLGAELLLEDSDVSEDEDERNSSENEEEIAEPLPENVSEEGSEDGDERISSDDDDDICEEDLDVEDDENLIDEDEEAEGIEEEKDGDDSLQDKATTVGGNGIKADAAGLLEDQETKRRRVSESGTVQNASMEQSLRSLKRLSTSKDEIQGLAVASDVEMKSRDGDGILSNEDFEHIRSLQAKRAAKDALASSGLTAAGKRRREASIKLTSPETLSGRRMDPAALEANVRKRREKEERIAVAKAGREDRLAFGSRTATKQKKTGGLSNREKEKRKAMPLGAVRAKVTRNKEWKKKKGSGKNQFRGKKAWKC